MPDRTDSLDDASSVLVLAPSGGGHAETCVDLLRPTSAGSANLLFVSLTGQPQVRLAEWMARAGGRPATARVVAAGEVTDGFDPDGPKPDDIDYVGTPNDMTGISIRVGEVLDEWAESDARSAVCFDSITALLQYVDVPAAYEFLHVLTGRLYAFGATGHFHLDPAAHSERTVARMQTLFDAAVRVDGEGSTVSRN